MKVFKNTWNDVATATYAQLSSELAAEAWREIRIPLTELIYIQVYNAVLLALESAE